MVELFEANWPIFLIAFLIGLAIAWYILQVRRTTRVKADRRDVLDEGAERARRNQALLDAPARPVSDTATLLKGLNDPPQPQPEPRTTVSFPLPGAIGEVESPVDAVAGRPATVSLPEQEGLNSPRETTVLEEDAGMGSVATNVPHDDPWRVIPVASLSEVTPAANVAAPAPSPTQLANDDLTRLKGIGPKLALRLNELGIARIEQIAGWDDAEIERIDPQLGRFQGRIRRDDWVAQAQLLAGGDRAAYEARFGKL